ncbi:RNI-like protein [Trametopsis cervina]|nr:RNI-like protein [Trametopsis cervina]
MSSSPSPSSSAVTIPTPGKSILKKPPPPPQSFFSLGRLSKLLPTQNAVSSSDSSDEKPLKRAHFILPELTTVYPIYSSNPPSTPLLKDEKRSIEEREAERRKRVVRRNSVPHESAPPEEIWWSLPQVESFYRECCVGREEAPDPAISSAILHGRHLPPRSVDFSGVQLTIGSASVLSDIFTIEWGLRKVIFKECDLDALVLKPILHSLLIPGSLTYLSVASNSRLRAPAFKLIGAYVSKASGLQFLDLAQNSLDKKSIEYIAAALPEAPNPGLTSLRLDDCALKPQVLDVLAHAVRVSSLRNISLRYNKINATGAVAVALMIKDYPDRFPTNGSAASSTTTSPTSISASAFLSPPSTPILSNSPTLPSAPAPPPRNGPILPPPRHPAAGPQTTYTPYIPRAKRAAAAVAAATPSNVNPLSPSGQPVPIITSSAQGGITARHPVSPALNGQQAHIHGPSAALLDKVRALDALPRLGALRTLDLRGNDIRTGITYIAQVLKRNRTLKVLNLSENKLDVQGLVAVAEALKYNSCLETLDLSKNPCCGPGLEGVQSLRTAFTLNNALKRLFMSSTGLTSSGAIALAEFLPESTSLLHLDLTMNNLDLAGVMALSSGLKANHVMRCLDLNIPPADEELARMCQDILATCVRNTEEAERATQTPKSEAPSGRGQGKGVWLMIEESELAKTFRADDKKKVEAQVPSANSLSSNGEDGADVASSIMKQEVAVSVLDTVKACKKEIEEALSRSSSASSSPTATPDTNEALSARSQESLKSLTSVIEATDDPSKLEEMLALNDELTTLLARLNEPRPELKRLKGLGLHLEDLRQPIYHGNGHPSAIHQILSSDDEEEEPITPRVDKGKGRAEPEPEEPQLVLTPTVEQHPEFDESETEHDPEASLLDNVESIVSPTDRSKSWVAEEGEVFRKGAVLLTPEEMETEYDSEELRKELLEAMVERPPPRALGETFEEHTPTAESPLPSALSSPVEPPKAAPRPYVRRSRSSSSIASNSPSTPTQEGLPALPPVQDES